MTRGAAGARQCRVRDIAGQDVPERVLGLAGHRRPRRRRDEFAPGEAVERRLHLGEIALAHRGDRARPEHLPDDGGVGEHRLVAAGRASIRAASSAWIESGTGRSAPLRSSANRRPIVSRSRSRSSRMNSSAKSGLPAARSRIGSRSSGAIGTPSSSPPRRIVAASSGNGCSSIRSCRSARPGTSDAARGAPGASSRSRASAPRPAGGHLLEEGQHRLVSPVEVLEDEHRRALFGEELEEPAPRGELLVARGAGPGFDPEEWQQPFPEPGPLVASGRTSSSLAIATAAGSVSRIPAWPFRISPRAQNAIPSRTAGSGPVARSPAVGCESDMGEELGNEPALAEPRLADDRREFDAGST